MVGKQGLPQTEEHQLPSIDAAVRTHAALVVGFPEPAALELPPSGVPVGREWLAAHAVVDTKVSGAHFTLTRPGGITHIEDAGSRNGTFVDGARISPGGRSALRDGSLLRVGRTLLVYREAVAIGVAPAAPIGDLVGPFGLRDVASTLDAFARRPPTNVLIEGETGTGKELVAAAVADRLRPRRPYAAVNVSSLASGVFESQLFGHVAGAFSGSGRGAPGVLAEHQGGTVFLDEIGELPLEHQPKLLRLLENREMLPVGAAAPVHVDVLLVAATNRSLDDMVEAGTFRRDLHARFAAARIDLPALRDRPEDLFAIAQALVARRGGRYDPEFVEVEAIERLAMHPWPANIRELAAVLERIAAIDPPPALRLHTVEAVLGAAPRVESRSLTREAVDEALRREGGNQTRAARALGVSRGQLLRFVKSHEH